MSPASSPPGENGKLIVTGAAGFIGGRLAQRLIELGEHVVAVDLLDHFKERPQIAAIYESAPPAEIVDRDALRQWLRTGAASKVGGIIHMGACTDTTNYDEAYLAKMNTAYSQSLWEWAAENQVPLLFASSAAVYGNGDNGYGDENPAEAFSPLNAYGWSKLRFDKWVLGEGGANQPPGWAGFRFFNVYGYGESHKGKMRSVLSQVFQQIQEKGEVRLFRSHKPGIPDGHQKRDFICVEDVVEAVIYAWRKGLPNGIYNLGTGRARTFLDLAEAAFSALGREPKVVFIDTPSEIRPRYQYFTEAKMDKIQRAGYTATFTNINEGARRYWSQLAAAGVLSG